MPKILIISDDRSTRSVLAKHLDAQQHGVIFAHNGVEGINALNMHSPDLVLLDLSQTGISSIEVCLRVRGNRDFIHVVIMIVSEKADESDVIYGLSVGADDYIIKPFSILELVARINARLRPFSATSQVSNLMVYGSIELDREKFEVRVAGARIPLTLPEFKLFQALMSRPGYTLSRKVLVEAITDSHEEVSERNVDVRIRGIRAKLGPMADVIETERGIGYRIKRLD